MANTLQRILSTARRGCGSNRVPFLRPLSTDSLVEIKPGEIGMVSGIPEEHLRRREEKYQRDYSQCDVYLFTHTTNTEEEVEQALERERLMLAGEEVDHEGPQLVFVDKRSEETYRLYQEELAKEMAQIAGQTPEGEQPPPMNKVDVWLRVVEPPKKGMTVYGMGSLSYSCLEKSTAYRSSSSSSCSSAQPSDYVQTAEFQQSVEKYVQKALSMYLGELKEANEHLKSEVASLTQQVRQLKGLDVSQDAPCNDP